MLFIENIALLQRHSQIVTGKQNLQNFWFNWDFLKYNLDYKYFWALRSCRKSTPIGFWHCLHSSDAT